jgi:hypothetical protein
LVIAFSGNSPRVLMAAGEVEGSAGVVFRLSRISSKDMMPLYFLSVATIQYLGEHRKRAGTAPAL